MKAQKLRGREGIVSARFVFLFILVLILLSSSLAQALEDWDIYSDADIIDGHYNLINIYDTPPDHTTVNMYGGSADFISTFDYSTLNFFNGNAQVGAFEKSIINISGGVLSGAGAFDNGFVYFSGSASSTSLGASKWGQAYLLDGIVDHIGASDFGVVNLHGGTVIDFIGAYDSSVVNLFGYNLTKTSLGGSYDNGLITGLWIDGSLFSIDLYGSETHSHIILHEIPEPVSLILFTLVALIIRKKK
jgi:hypothetical protein